MSDTTSEVVCGPGVVFISLPVVPIILIHRIIQFIYKLYKTNDMGMHKSYSFYEKFFNLDILGTGIVFFTGEKMEKVSHA